MSWRARFSCRLYGLSRLVARVALRIERAACWLWRCEHCGEPAWEPMCDAWRKANEREIPF